MTPKVSHRGDRMPSSPIRKLAGLASEAERKGLRVFRLNIGQPDIPTPPQAIERLHKIDRKVLEYSPSEGIESLRKGMSGYYRKLGITVDPDQIIVTSGGSEAVLFAFMACLDPGDEIIIPEPAYANYMAFAISAGAVIKSVCSRIEDGFRLPPIDEFEKLITSRTKGILICNPNNPTGYIYSEEELMRIAEIVKRHGLFLFSDEVYREFCYTGKPFISALQLPDIEENVVLIDSVSKRYNECGIRIGAMVTRNDELRKNVLKFCQARLSPPLLGQIVAEASLDTPEEYMRHVFSEYITRRDFLIKHLNEIPGVYSPMPMGAFYTVASLPVKDTDHFCRWCLEKFELDGDTVFMAPASGFYTTPELGVNQVRIAYVHNIEYLARAMDVLEAALEAYNGIQ
ncbi:MAG: pyridoxal phosphate-dependent aminotransferase [Lachnospiraceae bacterium]|nr:pyridoxal phosphate-dependent aminotransferase [Lachnospiraceae bacterium]